MNKWILLIPTIFALGGVGYWQYEIYLEEPENKIPRIVNNTSVRVSKALLYELEESTKWSKLEFADLFSKLEAYLAEVARDASVLQKMDVAKMSRKQTLHDATLYVQGSQQVLKAQYDKYIKWQDYSEALKTISIGEIEVTAKEDINIKKTEYEIAKKKFARTLGKFSEANVLSQKSIGEENLVDKQLIEKIGVRLEY